MISSGARIVINTGASYGRSLLALALGLFSSRWVLAALGKDDLGLFGLVGSIIVLVGMLNGILGAAVSRYYAYSIGRSRKCTGMEGLEDGIQWFNSALLIHTILPIFLVAVGYPLGVYALNNWLVIPEARMSACVWVFRLAVLSAFLNMVSVPYVALFTAKQLIAEVTVFQALQSIGTFCCAYFLLSWNGDRLVAYAFYMTLIPALVTLILVVRAGCSFPECSIRVDYLVMPDKLVKLFAFAGGDFFGWLGGAVRDQGMSFLINRNFGLGANAAYSISNQVSNHTMSLSNAMMGALMPAMTTAEGAGKHGESVSLAFRGIKFGVLSIALFAVPLIVEMDEILRFWLVSPPLGTALFCRCMLIAFICHKLGWGHHLAILAHGRVLFYQVVVGSVGAAGIVVAIGGLALGLGLLGAAGSFVLTFILMTCMRAYFARKLCAMSVRYWVLKVVIPIIVGVLMSLCGGYVIRALMSPSIIRVFIVTVCCLGMTVLFGYFVVCDETERSFVAKVPKRLFERYHHRSSL